jgi:hypothetical protein
LRRAWLQGAPVKLRIPRIINLYTRQHDKKPTAELRMIAPMLIFQTLAAIAANLGQHISSAYAQR